MRTHCLDRGKMALVGIDAERVIISWWISMYFWEVNNATQIHYFFFKNIQAKINQNFKNTLRTYLGHTLAEGHLSASLFCFFLFFFFFEKYY